MEEVSFWKSPILRFLSFFLPQATRVSPFNECWEAKELKQNFLSAAFQWNQPDFIHLERWNLGKAIHLPATLGKWTQPPGAGFFPLFPDSQTLPGFLALTGLLTSPLFPPPQPPWEHGLVAPSLAPCQRPCSARISSMDCNSCKPAGATRGPAAQTELAELVPSQGHCLWAEWHVPLLMAQEFLCQSSGKPCLPPTRRLRMNSLCHSPLQMQTLTRLDNPGLSVSFLPMQ